MKIKKWKSVVIVNDANKDNNTCLALIITAWGEINIKWSCCSHFVAKGREDMALFTAGAEVQNNRPVINASRSWLWMNTCVRSVSSAGSASTLAPARGTMPLLKHLVLVRQKALFNHPRSFILLFIKAHRVLFHWMWVGEMHLRLPPPKKKVTVENMRRGGKHSKLFSFLFSYAYKILFWNSQLYFSTKQKSYLQQLL